VQRQILIAFFALLTAAAPAAAQRSFDIPGFGTIYFGGGQAQRADERIDRRFRVLDRKRNYNDESRIVFDVGRREGRFSRLRIRAVGKVLRITNMQVVFGNGKSQDIEIYQSIQPGEVSPPLDLSGDTRAIRRVVITKRRTWQRDRGEVELLGLPDDGRDSRGRDDRTASKLPKGYSLLATERTGRRSQDVTFNDINSRHRWVKIRIKALDQPIRIEDVVIVFGNGKRQRVNINKRLRPGVSTPIINLDGREGRNIKRIRVDVERRRGPRGRLQVIGISERRQAVVQARKPRRAAQQRVPEGWVLFGSETVGSRAERQVLPIGRDAGVFDRITFRALRNDIHIRDVTVVYGNGTRDRRDIDLLVPAGYGTPPIDLKSGRRNNGRFIREIIVNFRSEGRRWGRNTALLQVYGEYADDWLRGGDREARGDNWIRLGARRAAMFNKDNDTISVGRRFGRFRAVKVRVRRNKVKLYGMNITYENGTTESVPVYGNVSAGASTKSFDLKGRRRFIKHIDLRYRTKFSLKGDGIVEVWGLR